MKAAGDPDGGRNALLCRNIPIPTNVRKQLGEGESGSLFIPLSIPFAASFCLWPGTPWTLAGTPGGVVAKDFVALVRLGRGNPTDSVQLVQSCHMPLE